MNDVNMLVEKVRAIDPATIEMPVLRNLVQQIQERTPEQLRCEGQTWTDTKWSNWQQHTSHNPW
jgi:hypothetical protein